MLIGTCYLTTRQKSLRASGISVDVMFSADIKYAGFEEEAEVGIYIRVRYIRICDT
jgi:hypothetical protein